MPKFRKKPVVIEAMLYDGSDIDPILDFGNHEDVICNEEGQLFAKTLEGDMKISPGDWVIKGIKGEFYPCKPDIFEATYEAVE